MSYQLKGATKSLVISLIFSHTNNILGDKFGGNLCSPTTVSYDSLMIAWGNVLIPKLNNIFPVPNILIFLCTAWLM